MTFPAAARAALGDVLTEQDMDDMFPLSYELAKGVYKLVRQAAYVHVPDM